MAAEAKLIVNIDVDDLPRAEAFYRLVFGLRPGRRFGYSGVELLGLPAPIWLLLKDEDHPIAPGNERQRDYRRHWTPVHLDIAVDDLSEATQRALAAGLDPVQHLSAFNSYPLFQKLGDLIETGPTGNNVRDVRILMAY